MPGRLGVAAGAIALPRTAVSPMAPRRIRTPAIAPAASSPTLWPAVDVGAGSSPATASAAATSSGWATAVSVISSALAGRAEPGQVAAG